MENQISFGNSWQTFISGPKGSSLSLTISGLVAGASYQIALVTGCPFEGAGAWNSLVTSNTYGQRGSFHRCELSDNSGPDSHGVHH
ncbi:hypothetical protein [Akkermansia muciniphila]|uniref:hypothetical protein n=1 Tax=Akkermansia muciniphila TaxID=239935 RepID=UPI0011AF0841|nr:hypothetical protein [Akkermansia muciniphila]MBT9543629.1 hypothetical protein [Akkermansia muciniphila]QWP07715.1 hypothetical protein J5W75_11140 [Akkermansia muciniphila]QWP09981.1 hypothetical protein J5W68_11130 [Akkermansia muciniphila]QWP12241.1 hypothetical protein J5W62_11120 [Akkermansia muciniphila]QWP14692.1 hypothetical protein J5W66_00385 [Akkermansia muciniphila]